MKNKEINQENLMNMQAIYDWDTEYFNIMVLDDDPSMTNLIRKTIGEEDFRKIHTFNDEREVIKSFSDGSYDACIIDVSLDYCNGFALGKILRSMTYKEFPIIYISKDKNYLIDFYKNSQPNSYFYHKPIIKNDFLDVFEMMTHQRVA